MSKRRPKNYLSTELKKSGLSGPEFAKLVGCVKQTISRYALDQSPPSVGLLFVCELLFGRPYYELFPDFFEVIEDELGAAVLALTRQLERRDDASARKALKVLGQVPARMKFPKDV